MRQLIWCTLCRMRWSSREISWAEMRAYAGVWGVAPGGAGGSWITGRFWCEGARERLNGFGNLIMLAMVLWVVGMEEDLEVQELLRRGGVACRVKLKATPH
jgi:hypothetical protein